MKQAISKSKSKKGRKREEEKKKIKISQHQHSKKERSTSAKKTARKGNTHTSSSQVPGGVAPTRNNRITESATKESREAKVKAKKAIQE